MSSPNPIPHRASSPDLLTPINTPPPSTNQIRQPQSQPHPMFDNLPDHKQHLLAIFSQGTHSFCQEDREEIAKERRKSFIDNAYPTPPGSRRPSFLSGLNLSRPFVFTSQPNSGTSTPISSSPKDHHLPHSLSMTPSTSTDSPNIITKSKSVQDRSNSLPAPVREHDGTPLKKVSGFYAKELKNREEKRHFDPSKEPRLLHLL